jgi:hypothetical protein
MTALSTTLFTAATGNTVTGTLAGYPTGSVLLATFTGGPSESSASAYHAAVDWGDGTGDRSGAPQASVTAVLAGTNIEVFGTHTYAAGGAHAATVALWVPGSASVQTAATIDVATDVTGQLTLKKGKPVQTSSGVYSDKVTITNPGTTSVSGSFDVLLPGLPPGVTVGATSVTVGGTTHRKLPLDFTSTGVPYVHIPGADLASLAGGQSVVLHLTFIDPSNTAIAFAVNVFSDPFDS